MDARFASSRSPAHAFASPGDWWTTLLGSGYRGTLERLEADAHARVREANLRFIRESRLTGVAANVIHAIVAKPEAGRSKTNHVEG